MRWSATAAFVLLFLAGCTGASPSTHPPAAGMPPVLAFDAPIATPIQCPGSGCYEPSVAVDGAGRIFVSNGATTDLAVSSDGGFTWTSVPSPPISVDPAAAAIGALQSDILLQASPSGVMYYSALVLLFNDATRLGLAVSSIQVASTTDGGKTWTNVAVGPYQVPPNHGVNADRQWLGFAPDGSMYLTYVEGATGVWIARSTDAGLTWGGWTRAIPTEERTVGTSGPPVVDAAGNVVVPGCSGIADNFGSMLVFISRDEGATFQSHAVGPGCNAFPTVAVAENGSLVAAWLDGADIPVAEIQVAWSEDAGNTWTPAVAWGRGSLPGPWPIPSPGGGLALTWYKQVQDSFVMHVSTGSAGVVDQDVAVSPPLKGPNRTLLGAASAANPNTDFANMARMADGRLVTVFTDTDQVFVAVQQ